MSIRTTGLRDYLIASTAREVVRGRVRGLVDEENRPEFRRAYSGDRGICLERARALTESFKVTDGEPMVIRRAKALADIIENMALYIRDGEIIVGNQASSPYALPLHPELYQRWVNKALNNGFSSLIDDDGRKEAGEICSYWEGKAIDDRARVLVPQSARDALGFNGVAQWFFAWVLCSPNYDKLFKVGLNGVIAEVEEKLKRLEKDMNIPANEYLSRKGLYEGIIIALKAAVRYGQRYAEKARELASKEKDVARRRELMNIADVCEWVPGNPPRTLHEALQFFWFIQVIVLKLETAGSGTGCRFDQIMFSFYVGDKEGGRITREDAQEMVECLWVKFEELGSNLSPPAIGGYFAGSHMNQTLTIGGVTSTGEDATNEFSYIMLDAAKAMQTLQPSLAIRYHDNIPRELVLKAIDVIHTGIGYPAFFNDKTIVSHLLMEGLSVEDARNYAVTGCVDIHIPGKNMKNQCEVTNFCLPKCLELALNKGVDKFTGTQMGYATPDPKTFTTVEDIMDAYLEQVNFFADKIVKINNVYQALFAEYMPRPFASGVLDGCIEKGKESATWSHYSRQIFAILGPTNVANSLAAIKKLVFEEKRITMDALLDALRSNFEGKEELHSMLREAPKYGNDNDYVDKLAAEVHRKTNDEIRKFTDLFGFRYIADGSGMSANFGLAVGTGATPDGRRDGEAYADGVLSPSIGSDTEGPTAVLKSASKVDHLSYSYLLNQKFLPQYLEGKNRELFARYLESWYDLGITHVQFNIVDRETLINAQKNPDEYKHLVVRVAGYSAYFADLSRDLQDLIIARTEQEF